MADTVEMREEGEIDSDGGENEKITQNEPFVAYTKLERPQEVKVSSINHQNYNSESSSDSDGTPHKKFMKRNRPPQQAAAAGASRSKNGSLWKNMLQEETLMENLKTCDVSATRKRKFERGAESYDFENARMLEREEEPNARGGQFQKRRKIIMDISGNDSSSSNASAKSKKRKKRNEQRRRNKNSSPKILPDLLSTLDCCEEDFGREMAQILEEEKCDLIVKVVSVIGKKESLNLFKITQKIEAQGGMLTMMKNRRRTPGGIFLFLLKTSDKIDEDLKREIFNSERKSVEKGIAERKMSSEAKDPPNSPANAEFTEINGKITDPDLVSQKILNFTKPESDQSQINEDVLELDYNYNDMDTF